MALVVRTDGSVTELLPIAPATALSLEQLQHAVEGYIEVLPLADGGWAVCNEEGRLIGMPYNELASVMVQRSLCGPVVLCDRAEVE